MDKYGKVIEKAKQLDPKHKSIANVVAQETHCTVELRFGNGIHNAVTLVSGMIPGDAEEVALLWNNLKNPDHCELLDEWGIGHQNIYGWQVTVGQTSVKMIDGSEGTIMSWMGGHFTLDNGVEWHRDDILAVKGART